MARSQLHDAVVILCEGTTDRYNKVLAVLEDGESPIRAKYKETLYKNIVDKGHVDFGDIPKSKGDITKYSGYKNMVDSLDILLKVGADEKSDSLIKFTNIVKTAIKNIESNKTAYTSAFSKRNDIAILEYNTFVFTCVEATSSIIYEFIDYLKTPSSPTIEIKLKDTKYRANLFYINQLEKFNMVNENGKYSKYLANLVNKGQENFFGIDDGLIIGGLALGTIALSIVPVTRELVYQYKELRRKLSETCALQAYFLEMNKSCIESNTTLKAEKKAKILQRQEKLRLQLLKLSDKLRVTSVKANELSGNQMKRENQTLSLGGLQDDIEDSDFSIL